MPDALILLGLGAAVFVLAALAQAVTGFGSALVAVPLVATVVDPVAAVVAATAVGLVLTTGAGWRERSHVDVPAARTLVVTGVLGMPLGLLVLGLAPAAWLPVLIAATVLVALVVVSAGVRVPLRGLPAVGVLSGALLTSTGMNGPPLVAALVDREPRPYRATLQVVFAAQDAVAVAAFLVLGHVHAEAALVSAGGLLGLPLGWCLGDAIFRRIPRERLRVPVVGGLVASAVVLLVTAVA